MKALCIDKNFDFNFIAEVERVGSGGYRFNMDSSGYMNRIFYPDWIRNTSTHRQITSRAPHGVINNRWDVLQLTEKEYHNIRRCIEILPQESFETINSILSIRFN